MADKITISIGPGKAVYPRLDRPDTKFDELGQYKADISIPMADAEPIMEELSRHYKAWTGKPPKKSENTMWYFETDEEGEETGNVVFKCRVKNKIRKKDRKLWDRKPALFDAALKPIDVNVYGGSTYIVSAEVYMWTANQKGVSLQPEGVQVIDLITGTGGPSAAAMGFQAQDGYVAPELDEEEEEEYSDTDVAVDEDDAEEGDY